MVDGRWLSRITLGVEGFPAEDMIEMCDLRVSWWRVGITSLRS